ncbi:MAG: thioredoxin-disulfide reductase [Deltaproteobacteria bacterium]|jgi:thioredoxin reductase (NADPH)|nr:thioredoxin-disulfide reductase [Deltaproteobacteria bacterium]
MSDYYDLVVIGAGPAGLTAAIYGCRAGLSVLVIEKNAAGGQMLLTGNIENWPGTALITGHELSEQIRAQAEAFGAKFKSGEVESLSSAEGTERLITTADGSVTARAVIVATGAYHKSLGCPGGQEFHGRGISYCAICDAGFFRNQEVAVVGGGNTALEQAMYLTNHASKVHLIHRRNKFRADKMVQDRLEKFPKIQKVMDTVVDAIHGTDEVESVKVRHLPTGSVQNLAVNGVFLFVGSAPNSEFLPPEVLRAPGGWVSTDRSLQTSWPGVFAAGDVRDTELRQIVTATGDGALAAMNVYRYLEGDLESSHE